MSEFSCNILRRFVLFVAQVAVCSRLQQLFDRAFLVGLRCVVQGSVAEAIDSIRVDPFRLQDHDERLGLSAAGSVVQKIFSRLVLAARIEAALQEPARDLAVAVGKRDGERCHAFFVCYIDVDRLFGQKKDNDSFSIVARSQIERRNPLIVGGVDFCSVLDQKLDEIFVSAAGGVVQRGQSVSVAHADFAFQIDQLGGKDTSSVLRRQVQRRCSVRIMGVDFLAHARHEQFLLQPDSYGMLPLHYASSTDNFEIGRLLLERYGADPNAKPREGNDWILRGRTPLHIAVTSANLDFVELLVNKGANLFAGDRNGVLPLHLAIQYGRLRAAKLLMARMGKKVHAHDANRTTPLHLAAQYGRGVLAAKLIDLKGKISVRNGYGLTPLHYAASGGHEDLIELLIENGAKINATNNQGVTPLYLAARDNRKRVVVLLLSEKSIDIDVANEEGMTSLSVALANGNGEISGRLLQRGFDARRQDKAGKNLLHHAASGGETKSLIVILKTEGINPNAVDSLGNAPLHYATQADKKGAVEELLQAGADSNLRNKEDETAQDIARKLGHDDVLSVLR